MIDPDALNVWHAQRLVGYLWRDSVGRLGFRYDEAWLSEGGFALSLSLPLAKRHFPAEDALAHRFFSNLLPEGAVREHIVRDLKLPNSDFDLLRAIGGECAGALSILPVERGPSADYRYRPLNEEDLVTLTARHGQIYAAWREEERPRLSLAGAQNKCPILLREGQYFLPQGEAPSSHILKFELADYRHLPLYETFTSRLAKAVGLPTVDIALRTVKRTQFAEIARFDRVADSDGEINRLHQEDFCQALGLGYDKKYQEFGGPSFAQCYLLLREVSSEPAVDGKNLLRWQIFNVLAGNSDGHAKNLALLYGPHNSIRLAPFYDLVCTRAIERIDHKLAFDVGGERDPGLVLKNHWHKLAQRCDVQARYLTKLVQETAEALLDLLTPTREAFETQFGHHPAVQRVEQVVTKQCRRVEK